MFSSQYKYCTVLPAPIITHDRLLGIINYPHHISYDAQLFLGSLTAFFGLFAVKLGPLLYDVKTKTVLQGKQQIPIYWRNEERQADRGISCLL